MKHRDLRQAKTRVESTQVAIDSSFDKLIVSLRTAIDQDGKLQKEISSFDDTLGSFRLALQAYKIPKISPLKIMA